MLFLIIESVYNKLTPPIPSGGGGGFGGKGVGSLTITEPTNCWNRTKAKENKTGKTNQKTRTNFRKVCFS